MHVLLLCSACLSFIGVVPLCCCRSVTELTDAEVEFGLIPHDDWFQPDWIDENKASASRADMIQKNVIYGGTCLTSTARLPFPSEQVHTPSSR